MSSSLTSGKVCIITGCSRGIGFELTKGILRMPLVTAEGSPNWLFSCVVLAVRSEKVFKDAVEKLNECLTAALGSSDHRVRERTLFIPLDLESDELICGFKERFWKLLGRETTCDVLLSNAGFCPKDCLFKKENAFDEFERNMRINYTGSSMLLRELVNIMTPATGRIVVTGSEKGLLSHMRGKTLASKICESKLTTAEVDRLAGEVMDDYNKGLYEEVLTEDEESKKNKTEPTWSWHPDGYSCVKGLYNLYCIALGKELNAKAPEKRVTVNLFHPGHCKTEVSQWTGNRTAAEGAEGGLWLASEPKLADVSGEIFVDGNKVDLMYEEKSTL